MVKIASKAFTGHKPKSGGIAGLREEIITLPACVLAVLGHCARALPLPCTLAHSWYGLALLQ